MTTMGDLPEVVSHDEWLGARRELLAKEKELTRALSLTVNTPREPMAAVRVSRDGVGVGRRGGWRARLTAAS